MLREDRPQVAIVGAGYWGKNLVRNFYRLGAVRMVYDQDQATVERMVQEHSGLKAAQDYQEILACPQVAGVVLAAPASAHYDLARRALEADKHVFVEKPLALTQAEGRILTELAAERQRVLMVDHLLQNHPAFVKLRELVAAGALGPIRHIHSRRLSFGKIRTEEDVLWSFAPHDLSMILRLIGREPETVAAWGGSWVTPGLADTAEINLKFPDGVTAQVSVSWLNPAKEQRLVVIGRDKMAVFDDTLPWPEKLKLYGHQVTWTGQAPTAQSASAENVALTEGEPLAAQCLDFLAAMAGKKKPFTDGAEGLRVLETLQAASTSLKNHGAPVKPGNISGYQAHPTAIIDPDTVIGNGCRIWHFTHVLSGSELGPDCSLGQNVVVGPKAKIGRGVKIQNNVSVYEGVTLEDEVFCGPSMVFTNVINPRSAIARKNEYRPTLVRRGATIGANATIVCGHVLGAWCFIGAGSVVTKDVPDQALMIGNPARQHGWVCRCGLKLPADLTCSGCGKAYQKTNSGLKPIE